MFRLCHHKVLFEMVPKCRHARKLSRIPLLDKLSHPTLIDLSFELFVGHTNNGILLEINIFNFLGFN